MISMLYIVFIVPLLSIAVSIYISLNYIKIEEPITVVKSPRKKIPVLKYTNDKIKEVSDDSIEGLVRMALNRKQKPVLKKEKKTKVRAATVPKPTQKSIVQTLSDEDSYDSSSATVLFTEKDELFTSSTESTSYPSPIVEPGKVRVEMVKDIKLYSPFKSGLVINLDHPYAVKHTKPQFIQSSTFIPQYQNSFFMEQTPSVTVGHGSDHFDRQNRNVLRNKFRNS